MPVIMLELAYYVKGDRQTSNRPLPADSAGAPSSVRVSVPSQPAEKLNAYDGERYSFDRLGYFLEVARAIAHAHSAATVGLCTDETGGLLYLSLARKVQHRHASGF